MPGDFDSWYKEFNFLATQLHDKAAAIDSAKFPVSAREYYFRSASYHRASNFFLHSNWSDPRINSSEVAALADFNSAVDLLPIPPIQESLQGDGFEIPIYFFPAKKQEGEDCEKLPTVILQTGYDGSQQALYHGYGRAVLDRGYNYISFEGPGQPTVRREQGLGFIENWWDVVSPVIDWLEKRPDVDTSRISLMGISFGGVLAPRAASKEHRLSAVVAVDGVTNMQKGFLPRFGDDIAELFNSGNKTGFDETLLSIMDDPEYPTSFRWLIAQGLYSFNTQSPFDWFTQIGVINAEKEVLSTVECPVMVYGAEDDSFPLIQAETMRDDLGDLASYYFFKNDVGAGQHCQLGAEEQLAQVTFDWMAGIWKL